MELGIPEGYSYPLTCCQEHRPTGKFFLYYFFEKVRFGLTFRWLGPRFSQTISGLNK